MRALPSGLGLQQNTPDPAVGHPRASGYCGLQRRATPWTRVEAGRSGEEVPQASAGRRDPGVVSNQGANQP